MIRLVDLILPKTSFETLKKIIRACNISYSPDGLTLGEISRNTGYSRSQLTKSNSFLIATSFLEKTNSKYKLTKIGLDYISLIDQDNMEANKILQEIILNYEPINSILTYIKLNQPVTLENLKSRIADLSKSDLSISNHRTGINSLIDIMIESNIIKDENGIITLCDLTSRSEFHKAILDLDSEDKIRNISVKICEISIKNFKSIANLKMSNIGDLTILIGKNSSGKTNILHSINLFFHLITNVQPSQNLSLPPNYWYHKRTNNPIQFEFTFELVYNEQPDTFTDELEIKNVLNIKIEIVFGEGWRLKDITLNNNKILEHFERIKKLLRNKFLSIPLSRNTNEFDNVLNRKTSINTDVRNTLLKLEVTTTDTIMDLKRKEIHNLLLRKTNSISKHIQGVGNELFIDHPTIGRIPFAEIGCGDQEVTQLITHIVNSDQNLIAIEEPESHLHLSLQRELFEIFKDFSNKIQFFISTHSTVFIDRDRLENTWLVQYSGRQTTILNMSQKDDLKEIIISLGIKPSDILLSDKILFVEGESDRIFFEKISNKLDISFFKLGIIIMPLYGASKGKRHLKLWNEITNICKVSKIFLLDKGTEEEVKQLLKLDGKIHTIILQKGELEDYYPISLIIEAIAEIYKIKLNDDENKKFEKDLIKAKKRIDIIKRLLGEKGKLNETKNQLALHLSLKVNLAENIANKINIDDIDEELKSYLFDIATRLKD